MNWGKGILLAIILFMIGVAVMVSISVSKDVDLVAPNYYEREIKYQDEIDRINNANKLAEEVKFKMEGDVLEIVFPEFKTPVTGHVEFYRPSDSRKDFRLNIETASGHKQVFNLKNLEGGYWRLKVVWEAEGKQFMEASSIMVNSK